jgi:UDP-3-O-[3-hydroxymyristoyl] glucosamine N-acyltransferase
MEKAGLPLWKSSIVIAVADPYWAMARLSALFASHATPQASGPAQIHPSAVVDSSARLSDGVVIGPQCVIEAAAEIGEGTRLHAGVVVGRGVTIGAHGEIFPNVSIYSGTTIGTHFRCHSGTVIGSDGFGYAPIRDQGKVVGHEKIYHLGGVRIGNHVEIGANSCVDRGTLGDTLIEDHVKADNLVQIAHNAIAREGAILCGCSGLAGGSVLGRFAYLGGQACVVNKAAVGDGAMVGAASLITKDVAPGESVAGSPQRPIKEHLRVNAYLNRLVDKKGGSQ